MTLNSLSLPSPSLSLSLPPFWLNLLDAYHLPGTVPGLFSKCSRSTIIRYMLPDCPVSEGKLLAAREVGNFSVIVLWDIGAKAGRKPGSQAAQYLLPLLKQRNQCIV